MKMTMRQKYKIYIENRQKKIDAGYLMEGEMSYDEFKEMYSLAKARGDKNIIREFVEAEQVLTTRDIKKNKEFERDGFKILTETVETISPTGRKLRKEKYVGFEVNGVPMIGNKVEIKEIYEILVNQYEATTGQDSPYRDLFYKKSSGGVFY